MKPFSSLHALSGPLALLLLLSSLVTPVGAQATTADSGSTKEAHDVASTFAGIHFQVVHFDKIAPDRLLVTVRIYGTKETPVGGVLVANCPVVPANITPEMVASGAFAPRPFSFAGATLTDDKTGQVFKTLRPLTTGPRYLPDIIQSRLHPGEVDGITLQFPVPPPPEKPEEAKEQTVTLTLPGAKGVIAKLLIPATMATTSTH